MNLHPPHIVFYTLLTSSSRYYSDWHNNSSTIALTRILQRNKYFLTRMQSIPREHDAPPSAETQPKPYSLRSPWFGQRVPEQRGLCIALQYRNLESSGLESAFHGPYEDAIRVRDMLIRKYYQLIHELNRVKNCIGLSDYRRDDIMILMDDESGQYPMPTRQKIVSSDISRHSYSFRSNSTEMISRY